jgi:hypothetical protein
MELNYTYFKIVQLCFVIMMLFAEYKQPQIINSISTPSLLETQI